VVVEHDEDTIRRADHIIDIGPGAGKRGGRVVAQGSAADLSANSESLTGRYLLHAIKHPLQPRRGHPPGMLHLRRANLHNLQQVDVDLPLRRLVAVTGVSGSGKSTLARDVLLHNVQQAAQQRSTKAGREADDRGKHPVWVGCAALTGYQDIDRVLEVDQTPIGKTPRSCPATYIGFGTPSASCLPTRWKPRPAAMARGAFPSIRGKAAAPPARVRACAPLP